MQKQWMIMGLSAMLLLTGCSKKVDEPQTPTAEPTSLPTSTPETSNNAGQLNLNASPANMQAYVFLNDANPAFLEISTEESLKLFVKGTGIVVYSYETCPWCNRILPVLNEAAKEAGINVFYVNIYSNEFMSKSNTEKSNIINSLYQVLDPILIVETDEETGEEKKVMEVPEVVAVKDGEIVGHHLGVVDSFKLDQEHLNEYQVTDSQVKELKTIYAKLIQEIQ